MSSFTKTFPAFLAVFILTTLALTSTHAANFEITNQCPYTVWGAATNGGRRLDPGETWSLDVSAGSQSQRIWGRTGCNFDGNGRGSCQTGDCAGLLECNPSVSGRPPLTLAEFSLNGGGNNDYYDISVIDGFNVPMSLNPTNGDCPQLTCRDPNCPDAYQFPTDDTKTKACPAGTNYKIVFCP
ncbi:hypothetical protein ACS0TY_017826 [Phlomoides rotata]